MVSRPLSWVESPAPRPVAASVPVDLTVVAPLHDEVECVEAFLTETVAALEGQERTFEIVCVDDGSTDGTSRLLRSLLSSTPGLRVLRLAGHRGQSAALAAGIRAARGRIIALIDADLQNDPADLPRLLRALADSDSVDAVVGWRRVRHDDWIRRVSSRVANHVARRLTGDDTHDAGCGLKVARAELLRCLPVFQGMHRFFSPLIRLQGGRVIELEVNHRPRRTGHSKYGRGLQRTLTSLHDALGVRWRHRRSLDVGSVEVGALDDQ
jgi:glycosyltransferase involved in cell wall biosynthesis